MNINIERNLGRVLGIIKDPEHFFLEKYYGLKTPNGFRIELFVARRFRLICNNLKQHRHIDLKTEDCWFGKEKVTGVIPVKKLREVIFKKTLIKHPGKTFCPYCEKSVTPRRHHKLDFGDLVLLMFTAGLWAIFLFAMYFFVRRCPVCNYNLRGFKLLSESNTGNK